LISGTFFLGIPIKEIPESPKSRCLLLRIIRNIQ